MTDFLKKLGEEFVYFHVKKLWSLRLRALNPTNLVAFKLDQITSKARKKSNFRSKFKWNLSQFPNEFAS